MTLEFLALAAWVAGALGAIVFRSPGLRAVCVALVIVGTAVLTIAVDRLNQLNFMIDLCADDGSPIYHSNDLDEADCDVISKFFSDFY